MNTCFQITAAKVLKYDGNNLSDECNLDSNVLHKFYFIAVQHLPTASNHTQKLFLINVPEYSSQEKIFNFDFINTFSEETDLIFFHDLQISWY